MKRLIVLGLLFANVAFAQFTPPTPVPLPPPLPPPLPTGPCGLVVCPAPVPNIPDPPQPAQPAPRN